MAEQKFSDDERVQKALESLTPRLGGLLCCDFANTTIEGKYNLFGIFDLVILRPGATHSFFVYVRTLGTRSGTFDVIGIDPDGSEGGRVAFSAEPAAAGALDIGKVELLLPFSVSAEKPGVHWFEVQFNGQSLGRIPLTVGIARHKDDANTGQDAASRE